MLPLRWRILHPHKKIRTISYRKLALLELHQSTGIQNSQVLIFWNSFERIIRGLKITCFNVQVQAVFIRMDVIAGHSDTLSPLYFPTKVGYFQTTNHSLLQFPGNKYLANTQGSWS